MILYIKENNENEVRYIDTTLSQGNNDIVRKKDWKQVYNQEPIKNDEVIRVYHGCDLQTAVRFAVEGISGKEWHPRKYSYESGMNPVGLFVSTSFQVVKRFSNPFNGGEEKNASVIIEFSTKTSDLDTPVWNGQDTYFGQGSNPMPFKNKEERDKQKEHYNDFASKDKYDYIKDSDNKALAYNIFKNGEHQALFIGDLNPNMIKRFWVKPMKRQDYYWVEANKEYIPMKRSEFLKEYGNQEFYNDGTNSKIKNNKLYLPNEDYDGIEGFAKRMEDEWTKGDKYIEKEKREGKYDYEAGIKDKVKRIEDFLKWNDYDCLKELLWPKQLIQLLGKEKYEEVFDRFGIGTKNESKQIKKIYIQESKLSLLKEDNYDKVIRIGNNEDYNDNIFCVPEIKYNGEWYLNDDEDAIPFLLTKDNKILYGRSGSEHDNNPNICRVPNKYRFIFGRVFKTEEEHYIIVITPHNEIGEAYINNNTLELIKKITSDLNLPKDNVYYYVDDEQNNSLQKLIGNNRNEDELNSLETKYRELSKRRGDELEAKWRAEHYQENINSREIIKEGYYGKHFEEEAENIANQIIQGIKNKETHLEFVFKLDNETQIQVNWEYNSKKCGYTRVRRGMRGKYFVRCIDIYGDENTTFNEYKKMLIHEFTHVYDTYKGFTRDEETQINLSKSFLIPWEIEELIYHL